MVGVYMFCVDVLVSVNEFDGGAVGITFFPTDKLAQNRTPSLCAMVVV
jgi:hypothetical protein